MVLYYGWRRGEGCVASMEQSGYAAAFMGRVPGTELLPRIPLNS
jgi:hypothetical protein